MDEPRNRPTETREQRWRRARVHRSAERTRIVDAYRASKLTQEQFAAKAGVKIGTLRGWIYKKAAPHRTKTNGFVPVRIIGDKAGAATKSRGAITVRWPQGIEVELALDLDNACALQLVRELLSPCLR